MSAHVYRVFDANDRLIYIGATTNLTARLAAPRWWRNQIARVETETFVDVPTARIAEAAAIRNENPRWNVLGRWASRSTWTRQDYADYLLACRRAMPHPSRRSLAHISVVERVAAEAGAA